jgi:hypothetical protein
MVCACAQTCDYIYLILCTKMYGGRHIWCIVSGSIYGETILKIRFKTLINVLKRSAVTVYICNWLIDWLFTVLRPVQEYFNYMDWIHHCQWRAAKFRPMLGAQWLWAEKDLYCATPAVTRDPLFCFIQRTIFVIEIIYMFILMCWFYANLKVFRLVCVRINVDQDSDFNAILLLRNHSRFIYIYTITLFVWNLIIFKPWFLKDLVPLRIMIH